MIHNAIRPRRRSPKPYAYGQFFSNYLTDGEHSVSYVARATRKGQFAWPAPRADAMYDVDVYGVGKLEALTVQ